MTWVGESTRKFAIEETSLGGGEDLAVQKVHQ